MPVQINKIGEIYREIVEEANRSFKIAIVGRDRVGKSELAAWFLMGNAQYRDPDIDVFTIVDIDDSELTAEQAVNRSMGSDLIMFVVDA
jgi:predicted GTPase